MLLDLNRLEEVLNKEFEIYDEIERHTEYKKQILIKCDMDNLKEIDLKIEKYVKMAKVLEDERNKITEGNNLPLKEIISNVDNNEIKNKILNIGEKIKNKTDLIKKQNSLNEELIKHGLKMLEFTVLSITNVLSPDVSSYNACGKKNKSNNSVNISSIIREA